MKIFMEHPSKNLPQGYNSSHNNFSLKKKQLTTFKHGHGFLGRISLFFFPPVPLSSSLQQNLNSFCCCLMHMPRYAPTHLLQPPKKPKNKRNEILHPTKNTHNPSINLAPIPLSLSLSLSQLLIVCSRYLGLFV
jgi:hypothetical protein